MKLIRSIRNLFRKKRTESNLVLLGEFDGHKLYGWDNIAEMPTKRYLAMIYNVNDGELGISRTDLLAYVHGISDCYKENNHTQVGFFVETIKFYLDFYPPEKVVFRIVNCLLLIDNEPVDEMSKAHSLIKAELFDQNEDFRAFFLRHSYGLLTKSGYLSKGMSEEDWVEVVKAPGEQTFSQLTGKRTYPEYLSD